MTEISWDRGWDTRWFGKFLACVFKVAPKLFGLTVHSDSWHQAHDITAGAQYCYRDRLAGYLTAIREENDDVIQI